MKLRGKIFGSFELVEFNLMDVVGYRNGCTMVNSDDLEAPIVYDTIEPALESLPEPMLYALQSLAIAAGKEYAKKSKDKEIEE